MNPEESMASVDPRRREIERLAYALWQNAGEPSGTAERDWLLAEHASESGRIGSAGDETGDT